MGMDREKLYARIKQPGHDQTFKVSEANFVSTATECLGDNYIVTASPKDLAACFPDPIERALGIRPEASIESKATGRKFFIEVKKQGERGNAEERACKHHTMQFYKTMRQLFPSYTYHPYITVFCEAQATNRRYTQKIRHLFEPDQYFLWKEYDRDELCAFLQARCQAWLD